MNLSSILSSNNRRRNALFVLSLLILMMIILADADVEEECVHASRRNCTILGNHNDGVEKSTDEQEKVSTQGIEAAPIFGGFRLFNKLPDILVVRCVNTDNSVELPIVNIIPDGWWTYSFDAYRYDSPWQCAFEWINAEKKSYLLAFDVWNHDGTYLFLSKCDFCVWSVHNDGFYILKDRNYFLIWKWYPLYHNGIISSPTDSVTHLSPVDQDP